MRGWIHLRRNIQSRVRGVGQGRTGSVDADSNTADEVAHADGQAGPEEGKAGVVGRGVGGCGAVGGRQLGREDDGHDDAVDGDDLAEDDGDEVLGADAGCFDATSEDGGAGDEDTPAKRSDVSYRRRVARGCGRGRMLAYHAAPTTDRPIERAMPMLAQA